MVLKSEGPDRQWAAHTRFPTVVVVMVMVVVVVVVVVVVAAVVVVGAGGLQVCCLPSAQCLLKKGERI